MHRSNAPLYFPWKCVYIPGTFPGCIIVEFRWRDIFCTLPTDEDELREFQAPRYKFNFLMLLELYGFLLADVPWAQGGTAPACLRNGKICCISAKSPTAPCLVRGYIHRPTDGGDRHKAHVTSPCKNRTVTFDHVSILRAGRLVSRKVTQKANCNTKISHNFRDIGIRHGKNRRLFTSRYRTQEQKRSSN
jgi:hypothetical protein